MSNAFKPNRFARLIVTAVIFIAFAMPVQTANAQSRQLPIVRDAEIEALVSDYARPIFQAAGLSRSGIDIILVNDSSFNAFVAGRRMFINTGALMIAESPNEIIGVMAHEAGHLAGGHQERLRAQLERAQTMAIVSALLGLGAAVAGAVTDSRELSGLGGGIAAGGAEVAQRGLLGYQRSEETTADRSALIYLEKTKQSPKGMIKTFERIANALSLSGSQLNPYKLSHPLPRERIATLSTLAKNSPYYEARDPAALQLRHDLARAKVAAFTQQPGSVARMFARDRTSMAARYAATISAYLYGDPQDALQKVDKLIAEMPNYPYFHELRGDILIKRSRPDDAAEAYATATRLDPHNSGVLQAGYGQALVASGKPEQLRKAVVILKKAITADRENPASYLLLAQAEGRLGNIAEADLATAEGHFYSGNFQEAKIFATRAQLKMKRGSPPWLRAQDIIEFVIPGKKK